MCRFLCVLALACFATQASAVAVFNFVEDGDDVVGTLSGTLDVSGLTATTGPLDGCTDCRFLSSSALILGIETEGLTFDRYLVTGPKFFWTNPFTNTGASAVASETTYSGDPFRLWGGQNKIYLPAGYDGTTELSGTLRIRDRSFASLDIKPGTYDYSLAFGGSVMDSLSVVFDDSPSSNVPLPGGAVLLLSALGGLGLYRRRVSSRS